MTDVTPGMIFTDILRNGSPEAIAWIRGNGENPQLSGIVKFYQTPYSGVLIEAEIFGMPNIATQFSSDFYAMHIHEFGDCSGSYSKTGNHFNPAGTLHPMHAGDLIPLLGNQGYAWTAFYDKRFTIDSIIGKSVIIHSKRDDFTTQPSGDSGEKIGCGVIRKES